MISHRHSCISDPSCSLSSLFMGVDFLFGRRVWGGVGWVGVNQAKFKGKSKQAHTLDQIQKEHY